MESLCEKILASRNEQERDSLVKCLIDILKIFTRQQEETMLELGRTRSCDVDWISKRTHLMSKLVQVTLASQGNNYDCESLAVYLALILQSHKQIDPNNDDIAVNLNMLYKGLVKGRNQKIAFNAACNAKDQERISQFIIKDNYQD